MSTNSIDPVEETLAVLDEFLLSDGAPDDSMGLSDLDGFLTAVAISPVLLKPSEWLPVIWGEDMPEFKSDDQAQIVMNAIFARYNEILRQIEQEPDHYAPIFWQTEDGSVIAMDWCEGFMDGVQLASDFWAPFLETRTGQELIEPIAIHLHDDEGRPLVDASQAELEKIYDRAAEAIPSSVINIASFFRQSA